MRLCHYKTCISALPLVAVFAWGTSFAQTRPEVSAPAQAALSTKTQPAKIGIRVPDSERNVKPSRSEVAQARFDAGQKSLLALQYADAIADFRAAIEVSPDFIGAHLNFITASVYLKLSLAENKALLPRHYDKQSALTRKTMPMPLGGGPAIGELLPIYEAWAQKWKSEPAVLWGLGKVLIDHDHDRASQLFNQVLEIDSNYAAAWRGLAAVEWQNKNQAAYGANLKKATTSDPSNPDFAMEYNSTLRASDPMAYQKGLKDIVARFPRSAVAYTALNLQLGETKGSDEKQAILQQMRRDYPNEDFTVHYFNMLQLYGLIAPQNPEQALEIIKELQTNFPTDKDLGGLLSYQQQMNKARELISEKNYAEATRSLLGLTLPRRADAAAYHLLLAEAVGAGDQEKAYQSLLAPAATPDHNLVLVTALHQLGKKLSKTPATIEDDLWKARVAQATPFKEFELIEYKSGKTVKLSDYRGKVVLVNFWFPGCGPCLNEFPLVQEGLKRYGSEGFVVLAINIIPDQDAEVLPLLEAKGFDFIPLKVPNSTWPREQYSVNAAPMNFLLDAQGRLIFKPKIFDQSTQSRFFGEIESLLKHRKQERPQPPTRAFDAPGAPKFTRLDGKPGVNPPIDADGDFLVGPEYVAAPETKIIENVPQGKVQQFSIDSKDCKLFNPGIARDVFGTVDPNNPKTLIVETHPIDYKRTVTVYVPAQYVPGSEAPFLVTHDGPGMGKPDMNLARILDNLIAQKRVPAMIAIMIASGGGDAQGHERGREYDTMSGLYAEFIENEVLPLVEKNYGVKLTKDPEGRATMGNSSGGSAALIMAWYHPELYHRVLTFSGTFVNQQWPFNPETPDGAWGFHNKLIPESAPKPLRIWMAVGDRDNYNPNVMRDGMHDWVEANNRMATVLKAKGYHYQYLYCLNSGHGVGNARPQILPHALEWLWRGYPIVSSR